MKPSQLLCLMVAAISSPPSFAACPGFLVAPHYPIGAGRPRSVAVGDLNGDGRNDLAISNEVPATVSVLLGDVGGRFPTAVTYPVALGPSSVAIADVNGDGKLDLVTSSGSLTGQDTMGGVSVLLGNGDGTVAAAVNYAAGLSPESVAVGDFDGDGKLDLAVANSGGHDVSILIGNGNGTFAAPVNYGGGNTPRFVAVGDFNGDQKADLAVANYFTGNFSILIGNGNGTFAAPLSNNSLLYASSLAVGDFNADLKADVAVTNDQTGSVSVYLGIGDGTFAPGVSYDADYHSSAVAVGDVNGDGKSDLVVNNDGGRDVSILLGNGNGTFAAAVTYAIGGGTSVAVADFNGDGKRDVAAVNTSDNDVSILLGNGNGTFAAARNSSVLGLHYQQSVAVADFNGDGKKDLATAEQVAGTIVLGNGDGTFAPPVTYSAREAPIYVAAGDFNGDTKSDLAVLNSSFYVSILVGNGNATFAPSIDYLLGLDPFNAPTGVAVGDFNGDSKPDLAVTLHEGSANQVSGFVAILVGSGNGQFGAPVRYGVGVGNYPGDVAVSDFNGDGKRDLAVANYDAGNVAVLLGNGDATFAAAVNYSVGGGILGPDHVVVADLNGDGKSDLVANGFPGQVHVLLGNGDGTFATAVAYPIGLGALFITPVLAGDVDGDGKADVVAGLSILMGNGTGSLALPITTYNHGLYPVSWTALHDFNGDGRNDLALGNVSSSGPTILLNTSACVHGDANGDSTVDAADLSYLVSYLFSSGPSPLSGDANGDGAVTAADALYLAAYLFAGGPAPV